MGSADLLWIVAMLIGLGLAIRSAASQGLSASAMYWAGVLGLAGGLLGGRALDLVITAMRGLEDAGWSGPKTYYGGLFTGIAIAAMFLRWRHAPRRQYLDAAAPAIALAYAIGRVGCFVNGDDVGIVTTLPWAVTYGPGTEAFAGQVAAGVVNAGATHSVGVHPVQLYESLIAVALFMFLRRQHRAQGVVFGFFCLAHATSRFAIEFVRADSLWIGKVSFTQLLSLGLCAIGLALVLPWRRRGPRYRCAAADRTLA